MNNSPYIHDNERLDDLQRNNLKIIQNPDKFCFGMDAVLLSGFVNAKSTDSILDLGTGTGIIPLLLSAKTQSDKICALEIQSESADMAKRSVLLNHLENRITITEGDIKNAADIYGHSSFEIITVNPPYMNNNHGLKNPNQPKAIARHEILCTLEDVISSSKALLKPGGHLFMVHRPFRLAEIITLLTNYRLEPKRMKFVHPFIDKEPNMVLIEAVLNGNSMIKIEKPLIVYESPGVYTSEIYDIYGY